MSIIWVGPGGVAAAAGGYDADAQAYIAAVEAADGQSLETAVKDAINAFVAGCKADGIWSAIKAACILAGARTLTGALVPLVGTAPTNNGFVSGDYNRKTGLIGNGSSKYLNSNRAGNADPQNSAHCSVYRTDTASLGTSVLIGSQLFNGDRNFNIYTFSGSTYFNVRKATTQTPNPDPATTGVFSGFVGASRSSSTSHVHRVNGINYSNTIPSITPGSQAVWIFAGNNNGSMNSPSVARLSFYSIGEALTLSALDARLVTLMSALAAAF